MARRRGFGFVFGVEPEPDPRPSGSLKFADPSGAAFPSQVHTFNDPHSPGSTGESSGVRSMGRYAPDPWQEMNRKRGVVDDSDKDGDAD